MTAVEEFVQIISDRRGLMRIISPAVVYALITCAEEGDEKPIRAAIVFLNAKIPVFENIERNFTSILNGINTDFEVGIVSIKSEERKEKMRKLREQEDFEEKDIEEALLKSLTNT